MCMRWPLSSGQLSPKYQATPFWFMWMNQVVVRLTAKDTKDPFYQIHLRFFLYWRALATTGCNYHQWTLSIAVGRFLFLPLFHREAPHWAQSFAGRRFIYFPAGFVARGRVDWLYWLPVAQEGRKGREQKRGKDCLLAEIPTEVGTSAYFPSGEKSPAWGLRLVWGLHGVKAG